MNKKEIKLTCDLEYYNRSTRTTDRKLDKLVKYYRGLYPDNKKLINRQMLINELTDKHIDDLTGEKLKNILRALKLKHRYKARLDEVLGMSRGK